MRVPSVVFMVMLLTAGPAGAQEPQVFGDLAEVMRGILFPNSNILFDAQTNNPDDPVEAVEGDSTSERFANIYTRLGGSRERGRRARGGRQPDRASARLRAQRGGGRAHRRAGPPSSARTGSSTSPACEPRASGPTSGAQARVYDDFDVILMTGDVAEACSNCHGVYRDSYTDPPTPRCTPPAED